MFKSPSHLPEDARKRIAESLNANLADGLDLQLAIKVAHWNIKGPRFPGLHLLFDTFAADITNHNDTIAERAVTLGAKAFGTARHVAKHSRLPEYPGALMDGDAHVRALTECFASYATALRADIAHATEVEDAGSAALYTDISRGVDTRLGFLEAYLHHDGSRIEPTRHNGRRAE